jgi:D-alanine-D-alanine ligase
MSKKLRIAVIMGGPSSEHEVSLHSGREVIKHLDPAQYHVYSVLISKAGNWKIGGKSYVLADALKKLKRVRVDLAFIVLHGKFGEDGIIQALLEEARIPYTGSGVLSSALAMNKPVAYKLFRAQGLLTPEGEVIEYADRNKSRHVKLPSVIKPANGGSSVGVSIVWKQNELEKALKRAFKVSKTILVEEYIEGREVTCGVLEDRSGLVSLPPTEIIPKSGFFDYQAKYEPGATEEITPANFPKRFLKEIQNIALTAHKILKCAGMSRTDMIVKSPKSKFQKPKIYVLETNTIPGMTKTSLLPQAAEVAGISFSRMLDMIIDAA